MWWHSRCLASLTLASFLWLLSPWCVCAQPANSFAGHVVYVEGISLNKDGQQVLLRVSGALPMPVLQLLPGSDGRFLLAFDFAGVVLRQGSVLYPLNGPIESVRIGQFQSSPPVVRVLLAAHDRAAFKKVDFRSANNKLVICLPESLASSLARATDMPPLAPAIKEKLPELRGPIVIEPQTALKLPAGDVRAIAKVIPRTTSELPKSNLPTNPIKIGIDGRNPGKVLITLTSPVEFKCQRLQDPERYVLDFEGISNTCEIEQPVEHSCLNGIRLGYPEDLPGKTRVVLDLSGKNVEVHQELNQANNLLSLALSLPSGEKEELPSKISGTVVLDPGHGGSDPGAQRGDVQEKEITLAIAQKVKKCLEASGVTVILTRKDDSTVPLDERVRLTNTTGPDAFVSVHINSLEIDNNISGIETYFENERSQDLAQLIHGKLVQELNAPDRSIRKAQFYVINHTVRPAVLAEVGFISNKEERNKLISSDYQDKVAHAVASGVILYLANRANSVASKSTNGKKTGTTDKKNAVSRII